jgi:predicted RNase H-like nuclease
MRPVIGVDGCPAGWIAVVWGSSLSHRLCRNFAEVLAIEGEIIAVDMPIGFLTEDVAGGRLAERSLRKFLRIKHSSVFPVPARATVEAGPLTREMASEINRRNSNPQKSIGAHTFGIMRKMHEIDRLMTSDLQTRVFETHPEACFAIMNDNVPIYASKKKAEGRKRREAALNAAGFPRHFLPPTAYLRREVGADDLLDACACAWAARRILEGRSIRFPANPPSDAKGLRMEINA